MTHQLLKLTDKAITHIKTLISKKPEAIGFRLSIKETGCTGLMYMPELVLTAKKDDIHFIVEGLNFYVDPACEHAIKGTTIDLEKKALGQTQLVFDNPNADSLCGCGESFNLKKINGKDFSND